MALSRRHAIVVGLPLVLAIGWLDYVTGPDVAVSLLYLIPVIAVAWLGGGTQGMICAATAAACRLADDHLLHSTLWNAFTWLVVYLGAAFLVARIKFDRQQLQALNDELQHALKRETNLARTDPLTGLANSRAFQEHLSRELARARRESQPVCVLFLDLDDFKSINDHYGHAVGDDVLTEIGKLIHETVRTGDVVARMGGDEFLVLLWHTSREEAVHVAERIASRVASFAMQYPKTRLGVSIGIAWFAEPPADPEDVLRVADREMYEEKAARKN